MLLFTYLKFEYLNIKKQLVRVGPNAMQEFLYNNLAQVGLNNCDILSAFILFNVNNEYILTIALLSTKSMRVHFKSYNS